MRRPKFEQRASARECARARCTCVLCVTSCRNWCLHRPCAPRSPRASEVEGSIAATRNAERSGRQQVGGFGGAGRKRMPKCQCSMRDGGGDVWRAPVPGSGLMWQAAQAASARLRYADLASSGSSRWSALSPLLAAAWLILGLRPKIPQKFSIKCGGPFGAQGPQQAKRPMVGRGRVRTDQIGFQRDFHPCRLVRAPASIAYQDTQTGTFFDLRRASSLPSCRRRRLPT